MFTFNVPAGHKPAALSNGEVRYALSHALYYRTHGQSYLATCNGKALAILPVDATDAPETPMLLPAKAIDGNAKGATVSVNGEVRRMVGKKVEVHEMPAQEGRWPNLSQVVPADVSGRLAITLDAKMLAALASAISADGVVTLFIDVPEDGKTVCEKPIAVVGASEAQGFGVLMPLGHPQDVIAARRQALAQHHANIPTSSLTFQAQSVAAV